MISLTLTHNVHEREQDGGSGCAGTHRLGAGGGAHAGAGCSAAPEGFLCHAAGCAFQLRRKNEVIKGVSLEIQPGQTVAL